MDDEAIMNEKDYLRGFIDEQVRKRVLLEDWLHLNLITQEQYDTKMEEYHRLLTHDHIKPIKKQKVGE